MTTSPTTVKPKDHFKVTTGNLGITDMRGYNACPVVPVKIEPVSLYMRTGGGNGINQSHGYCR